MGHRTLFGGVCYVCEQGQLLCTIQYSSQNITLSPNNSTFYSLKLESILLFTCTSSVFVLPFRLRLWFGVWWSLDCGHVCLLPLPLPSLLFCIAISEYGIILACSWARYHRHRPCARNNTLQLQSSPPPQQIQSNHIHFTSYSDTQNTILSQQNKRRVRVLNRRSLKTRFKSIIAWFVSVHKCIYIEVLSIVLQCSKIVQLHIIKETPQKGLVSYRPNSMQQCM